MNQDGGVELNDIVSVYNDESNFVLGHINTDLNGDNVVDLSDMTIEYNNAAGFVGIIRP